MTNSMWMKMDEQGWNELFLMRGCYLTHHLFPSIGIAVVWVFCSGIEYTQDSIKS